MIVQLKKILKSNYNEGVFHTHVSMIAPKGKFQFNRQTLEEFWNLYCNMITDTPTVAIGIAEKSQTYLPVLVDVDLKIKDDDSKDEISDELYTQEQLQTVIQIYQSTLRQIVNDCNETDLTCVALEKKMYQQSRGDVVYFKHGFHLHFPFLFLNKMDQEVQLIPRVKQELTKLKLFSNLGMEDSGVVIDKSCCRNPWLLYGSRKSESHEPYRVTNIYDANLNTLTLDQAFRNYQIFDNKERLINIHGKIEFYLPRILSIIPYNRQTKELKRGLVSIVKENMKKERKESKNREKSISNEESLKLAKKLIPLISSHRAEDYNEWMTIGWCLYNISDGEPEGLDLWCEFSSKCEEKYDESGCIYHWERMTKQNLTIGTLKYYAKIDNPEEYKKIKDEQVQRYITESIDGSHNDIARALYAEYSDEFVCASVTNKIWFHFHNHKWEQNEDGTYLREKISSGNLIGRYTDAVKKLYDELRDCQDENKGKEGLVQTRIKQINKIITNLKSAPFKNNVMRECCEVFYDERFRERLDADPYLIAFKNGVYDLKANAFRPGRPEDFLSKNMPINYINYSRDDEKVQDVLRFFEQIFPDKSIRDYFMDVSSDIFVGGNHEKIVLFWTGEGDNGKSVTQNFFEMMMGKLAIKLNTNVVTGKKPSAGSAFADLARAGGGVRWVVMEEPDADEMINTGIFKHLSGNDSFYARDLFERGKDGREIKPMFKLIFVCNRLPKIKAADKAVWNRVRVIPFESTFCRPDNPAPDTYEEQMAQKRFPMDKQLSKKIPTMVEALAWLLIQHRIDILDKPRIEPEKVRDATNNYRRENDIYRQFEEDMIIEDRNASITLTEVYNLFKDWYRESLPGHTVPAKNDVCEFLSKTWGVPDPGKKWRGRRQRVLQDDVDAGDAIVLDDTDLVEYKEKGN